MTEQVLRDALVHALSYVKVAEWQRRGLIHFHAAIRLDTRTTDPDDHQPPPNGYTLPVLETAIRAAVSYVEVPLPDALCVDPAGVRCDHSRTMMTSAPAPTTPSTSRLPCHSCATNTSHTATDATCSERLLCCRDDCTAHSDHAASDNHSARGGRGSQGLASDAGGCAAGTLDGTGHHPPSNHSPPQRAIPRDEFDVEEHYPILGITRTPRSTSARWGVQIDIRPIHPTHLVAIEDQLRATDTETTGLSRGRIAGYLAKYATKDTEVLAQLRPNLDIWALCNLAMPDHVRRLAVTAWLQARAWPNADERHKRLRRWTHQFGYGGHYLTKSRRYSTTFTALRQARRDWQLARRRQQSARDAERRITVLARTPPVEHVPTDDHADSNADPHRFALVVEWRLDGIGWRLPGDALLARTARAQALAARGAVREQRHRERELRALID